MVALNSVVDLGDGSLEVGSRSLADFLPLVLSDSLLWSIVRLSSLGEDSRVWVEPGHQGLVLQWIDLGGS